MSSEQTEIANALLPWHNTGLAVRLAYQNMHYLFECTPGSRIYDAMFLPLEGWRDELAVRLHAGDWLEFWDESCAFGTEPKQVNLPGRAPLFLRSLEDLALVIAYEQRQAAA